MRVAQRSFVCWAIEAHQPFTVCCPPDERAGVALPDCAPSRVAAEPPAPAALSRSTPSRSAPAAVPLRRSIALLGGESARVTGTDRGLRFLAKRIGRWVDELSSWASSEGGDQNAPAADSAAALAEWRTDARAVRWLEQLGARRNRPRQTGTEATTTPEDEPDTASTTELINRLVCHRARQLQDVHDAVPLPPGLDLVDLVRWLARGDLHLSVVPIRRTSRGAEHLISFLSGPESSPIWTGSVPPGRLVDLVEAVGGEGLDVPPILEMAAEHDRAVHRTGPLPVVRDD